MAEWEAGYGMLAFYAASPGTVVRQALAAAVTPLNEPDGRGRCDSYAGAFPMR